MNAALEGNVRSGKNHLAHLSFLLLPDRQLCSRHMLSKWNGTACPLGTVPRQERMCRRPQTATGAPHEHRPNLERQAQWQVPKPECGLLHGSLQAVSEQKQLMLGQAPGDVRACVELTKS